MEFKFSDKPISATSLAHIFKDYGVRLCDVVEYFTKLGYLNGKEITELGLNSGIIKATAPNGGHYPLYSKKLQMQFAETISPDDYNPLPSGIVIVPYGLSEHIDKVSGVDTRKRREYCDTKGYRVSGGGASEAATRQGMMAEIRDSEMGNVVVYSEKLQREILEAYGIAFTKTITYNEAIEQYGFSHRRKHVAGPPPEVSDDGITCDEPLSATRVASLFKELGVTREDVVYILTQAGYIVDIRTATPFGLANGVEMKEAENGGKYPVYGKHPQKIVHDYAVAHPDNLGRKPSPRTNKSKCGTVSADINAIIAKKLDCRDIPSLNIDFSTPPGSYYHLGIDDFVIIDTETTGLKSDDEVIELAVVDVKGNTLYHSLFKPYKEISKGAAMVNHISMDMLENQPDFADEWENIKASVGGKKILCHNTPFDRGKIVNTLDIHGGNGSEALQMFFACYDSVDIAHTWITAKSHSLQNCAKYVGIKDIETHRADDDCRMTLEFLNRLEKILGRI